MKRLIQIFCIKDGEPSQVWCVVQSGFYVTGLINQIYLLVICLPYAFYWKSLEEFAGALQKNCRPENSSSRMDIPDAPVLPLAFLRRHKLGKSSGLRKSSVKRWTSLLENQTSVGKSRKEVLHTAKRTRHLETYVGRIGNLSRQKMLWLNS